MNLNFILPYKKLNEEPPYPFMNGPVTCEIVNRFSVTYDFEIKNKFTNYLLIETFEKFKLVIRLLDDEFNEFNIKKFVSDNNIKLLICSVVDPSSSIEKNKIVEKIQQLNLTNLTFFLESNFQHKNHKNTLCWHFFLEDGKDNFYSIYNNVENELGYISKEVNGEEINVFRNKKFLCFNRLIDRKHRLSLLCDYINNDFNDSYFSFLIYTKNKDEIFQDNFKKEDIENFKKQIPIEIDTHLIKEKLNFINANTLKKELFLNSCIHIVTETSFEDNELFISEKIFKPILGFQPFIVMGPYRYLNELKKYGFKTFSDFWDESYDEIETPKERYDSVMKTIFNLNSKSIEELNELYLKTKEICIHNKKQFYNIRFTINNFLEKL